MTLEKTLLVVVLLNFVQIALSAVSRPNVIIIVADDFGYNDIGYHGSEIETPTLDKLAASGVRLENYYVQPICTPTRSQLLTGRYQIHTGLQHLVLYPEQPNGLPPNISTLADKMKESGYSTHMIGKWHLGIFKKEYLPWNRGFDSYFGYLLGCGDYYNHTRDYKTASGQTVTGLDLHNEHGPVKNETGHYSAHLFTQKAIDVINGYDGKKPFFMYLAYQSVHSPLEVPKSYEDIYKDKIKNKKRRIFAGMVSAMDEGIRNFTQALRDKGMWDNSVVIFTTDNGGKTANGGNNYPLRGEKKELWEGGVHGVGFVTGGALNPDRAGSISRELMHVSDWFPTVIGLAGGNISDTLPIDGVDQWDSISSGSPSKRQVILHNIDPLWPPSGSALYPDTFNTSVRAAIRVGDYKLITGDPGPGKWTPPPHATSENDNTDDDNDDDGDDDDDDDYDILYFHSEKRGSNAKNVWLFNITADPTEENDLSDERPDVVKELLKRLTDFNKTAVPVRFPDDDPNADPAKHGGVWGPWM